MAQSRRTKYVTGADGESVPMACPFLKWAGGKSQLLPQFETHFPKGLERIGIEAERSALTVPIRHYIEPFMGGSAVFFHVVQRYVLDKAYLSDANPDLVHCYRIVKTQVEALVTKLSEFPEEYLRKRDTGREKYFYQIREAFNTGRPTDFSRLRKDDGILRAAQLIFLNKTCYNGLYRTNSSGAFNTPFGRYIRPNICDAENLRRVSRLLAKAEIVHRDFAAIADIVSDLGPEKHCFIYYDPPYRPISATSSFNAYHGGGFDDSQQIRLSTLMADLNRHGVFQMLSNSNPKELDPTDDFFEKHFKGPHFRIHEVQASRSINSKAMSRGKISELLILNYDANGKV